MKTKTHEPKIRKTAVRVKGKIYPRVIVDFGTVNGRRERKTFKTKDAAEKAVAAWQSEQAILSRRIGEASERFMSGNVQDAAAALAVLGPGVTLSEAATTHKAIASTGLTVAGMQDAAAALAVLDGKANLQTAAEFFMSRHFPEGGDRTVDQLVEDYIESRRKVERRHGTIRDIRGRLGCGHPRNIERAGGGTLRLAPRGFAFDFAGVPAAHVTTDDLEKWMERHAGKAKASLRGYRVHLVGLFNFAMSRKYIRENPATALETPRTSKAARARPYVMPASDVEKALRYAAANAPEMIPYMALCLFAGVRPTECTRLTWADIDFGRNEIDIRAETSKTGEERFIEMTPNLVAWLRHHRKAGAEPIPWSRAAMRRIRQKSGARFEHDCMRHSFGSYHLAQFENAGKTALQMGHRSLGMLFEHYRRAVRKEEAARFWAIRPDDRIN